MSLPARTPHSIYGTNAFQRQSLVPDQRPELQAAIGREAEAEALAWLFCAIGKQHCVIVAMQEAAPGTPLSGLLVASAHQYSFANDFMAQIDHLRGIGVRFQLMHCRMRSRSVSGTSRSGARLGFGCSPM